MLTLEPRAGRLPLALTLAAASVLAACSDHPSTTGPVVPRTPSFAFGDIITVMNTSGGTDAGSLRWAVAQATGGEIIRFDAAIAGKTIVIDSTVKITSSLTIEGPQDKGITIHGGNKVSVFHVTTSGPTTLRNLTITGGKRLQGFAALASDGSGTTTLEHTTVTGNSSDVEGSVVFGANLAFVNSTITSNTTAAQTPTIYGGKLTVINSTIANNQGGGGMTTEKQSLLKNSVIANNGVGPNCKLVPFPEAAFVLEGANLADDATCGDSTKVLIAEPQLDSLKDNGGPTRTRRPLVTSPALNAGKSCDLPVDQRYVARDTTCDLGAVEFAEFMTATVMVDGSATVVPATGATTVTGTAKCSRAGRLDLTVKLQQTQKAARTPAIVQAEGVIAVDCGTTARAWGITLVPASGTFTNGAATATVTPPNVDWLSASPVTGAVKLYWGHK